MQPDITGRHGPLSATAQAKGLRWRHMTLKSAHVPNFGAIAQLGERLHGMQEVGGSTPPGSTSSRHIAGMGFRASQTMLEANVKTSMTKIGTFPVNMA